MPIAKDINADTRAIADLLNAVPFGGTVTLDAMSDALGRDIRTCRHLALLGIRVAERETGAVFASVYKVGYRRLTSSEFDKIGQTTRARIRRTANRSVRSMEAALSRVNDMDNGDRIKVLREQSTLGLVAHLSRDKNLVDVAPETLRPQPLAITMRAAMASFGVKAPDDRS